jgi:signal transduction histidine kinase
MNRWYDVYAFRIGPAENRKVALLFKDINDRKRLEQEKERLLAQAEAARVAAETANRIKDEFLAVLSHELRSPLNPILGWAKLLQTGKMNPTKTTEALKTIERNANLQSQLIDDLLDVSRILQGKFSLQMTPVKLERTIAAALETVRLAAQAKQFKFRLF